jgi:uncharacterized Zn-finger protein
MIEVCDEVQVDTRSVVCDGGNDSLGHPRVFLAIGLSGQVECPYCSRRFIFRRTGDHPVVEPAPGAVAESAGGSS